MSPNVEVERHARVACIRIRRPEKKNSLITPMYEALADALAEADADPGIRVAVLTGSEGVFTAGHNVPDFVADPPRDESHPVFRFIFQLPRTRIPLIAAVDGLAVGVGTTALLHCDFVYATPRATFLLPFVNLGVVPEAASSLLLPRIAGLQRASELLMLGEPFDASVAREIGLVNAICEPDTLEATALDTAARLAAKPHAALLATKALLRRAEEPVEARMREELARFAERLESPHAREAVAAFTERRAPDFEQFG